MEDPLTRERLYDVDTDPLEAVIGVGYTARTIVELEQTPGVALDDWLDETCLFTHFLLFCLG